jgi:hypothetical protein
MAVPTSIADLSTTAASNYPAGSESIGTNLDDYLRAVSAIVKQQDSRGADIASGTSITIPAVGNYFVITGTTTINTIADSWTGRYAFLEFSGALQLTHSSGLILPGAANKTTAAGDCAIVVNETTGVWRVTNYQPATGYQAAMAAASQAEMEAGTETALRSMSPLRVAQAIAALVAGNPTGTIIDFAGTSAPTGYLACPTTQTDISRTTYAALFSAIGTTWGAGNGSTTFGMPWFAADYASVQSSSNVGTESVGVLLTHSHATNSGTVSAGGGTITNGSGVGLGSATATTMTPTGGTANLAAGVRVLKCVKY